MQELIHQLGIDWRSLVSQAVNFLILLVVLRFFAYKPILKILKERKARIEEGVAKAREADERLNKIQEIGKEKLKEAEGEAINIIKKSEEKAKIVEAALLVEASAKEADALKKTELLLRSREEESRVRMNKEAAKLVKDAIIKTVELAPDKIDEALIEKAVAEAGKSN